MKHIYYTLISGFVCILALVTPLNSRAQCSTCAGGVPSQTIEHTVILDTTTASTNTITFPMFPPSTGTLTCVTFYDTISLVATSGARNRDPYGKFARFLLSLSPNISGHGINIDDNVTRTYGPTWLEEFGLPGDSTTYGPDTVFNDAAHQQTIPGTGSFLGTGNLNFTFDLSGGLLPNMGGINYNLSVVGKLWGKFRIVYSYCPMMSLPEIFRQFTAVKQSDNTIQLSWSVTNDQISNSYEIEISHDGRNFTTAGKVASQYAAQGAAAKYNYQYLPDKAAAGKLFFRIKQLSADGKGQYSAIRQVGIGTNAPITFITYPNPVRNQVTIQADQLLRGKYLLELVSASGQQVMKRTTNVNNSSQIIWQFPSQPAPGVYYLRTRELASGQTASYKVLVNR
ncbi:choice-of-anchor E domain-containing protein [Pseudoflavitalea rhizosphaerae]|uniref:choice-of-anchor E domain-containing protein n=1 Tax=Pseudoflavitalea rhizosphaerae TaxID=1884793 RepID=UPI000F8F1FB1|nr:choice-of-anchor E domain-containing protein [Pseudoflavitalea rhizosphaerae]